MIKRSVRFGLLCACFSIGPLLSSWAQFSISPNHRYLLRDGKPFFWMGDTGWELFHRLDRQQADQYLKRRAQQGFTVIQAVALAEFDGLHTPNAYGDLPLTGDDPSRPNEAYFQHVDYVVDKAAEYGLTIAFLPTWGDKIEKKWGEGPLVFTVTNVRAYGQWLGRRYKNRKNIIWILGGDRNPANEQQKAIWRAMAAGIREGVGAAAAPVMSYHPQPNEQGSGEFFYDDDWFSFNMFQNGHCRDMPLYDRIQGSYNRKPAKPVIDGECLYEDHPVCFNAKDLGVSSAYDIRKYAYLDLFAGAFGHTYGCHDIWQFYSPARPGINGPHVYWQEALELPGARQMRFVRRLMESHPLTDRVPDQSLIVEGDMDPARRIQATRGIDYGYIYSSEGLPFTVNLEKIAGNTLHAYWFDPRNGESKEIGKIDNKGSRKFTPPSSGYGQDWILVVDDASKYQTITVPSSSMQIND